MKTPIASILLVLTTAAAFAGTNSHPDFQVTKRTAADEKKHLLVIKPAAKEEKPAAKKEKPAAKEEKPAAKEEKPAPRKGAAKRAGGKDGPGRMSASVSDALLQKNLEGARAELRATADKLAEQHTRWEKLDQELAGTRAGIGKLEAQLEAARGKAAGHQKAIADLQVAHDKVHAAEAALRKSIATHEAELRRRAEIAKLQEEARQLQERAETLRKKADALRGE